MNGLVLYLDDDVLRELGEIGCSFRGTGRPFKGTRSSRTCNNKASTALPSSILLQNGR